MHPSWSAASRSLVALFVSLSPIAAAHDGEHETAARVVSVVVEADGFHPSTIEAAPGAKLRLDFTRPKAGNCGESVVLYKGALVVR